MDVDAKDELKRALKEYKGTILMVCHEPEFMKVLQPMFGIVLPGPQEFKNSCRFGRILYKTFKMLYIKMRNT